MYTVFLSHCVPPPPPALSPRGPLHRAPVTHAQQGQQEQARGRRHRSKGRAQQGQLRQGGSEVEEECGPISTSPPPLRNALLGR